MGSNDKHTSTQLWKLIFLYVSSASDLGLDEIDVLSFIFLVSTLEFGLAYSALRLSETQNKVLAVLSALGVVYWPNEADSTLVSYFYPTQLCTIWLLTIAVPLWH